MKSWKTKLRIFPKQRIKYNRLEDAVLKFKYERSIRKFYCLFNNSRIDKENRKKFPMPK